MQNTVVQQGLSLEAFIALNTQIGVHPPQQTEINAYAEQFAGKRTILVAGAGYGRESVHFVKMKGHEFTLIEPNQEYRDYLSCLIGIRDAVILKQTIQETDGWWYVACMPYGTFCMFPYEEQEDLLAKLTNISGRVIIDTIFLGRRGVKTEQTTKITLTNGEEVLHTQTCYLQSQDWYKEMGKNLGRKVSFQKYKFCHLLFGWLKLPVYHTLVVLDEV